MHLFATWKPAWDWTFLTVAGWLAASTKKSTASATLAVMTPHVSTWHMDGHLTGTPVIRCMFVACAVAAGPCETVLLLLLQDDWLLRRAAMIRVKISNLALTCCSCLHLCGGVLPFIVGTDFTASRVERLAKVSMVTSTHHRARNIGRDMASWLVAWLVPWLLCWRALWLLGWSVGCLIGWRIGWLLLVGWLLDWLAAGLAGWLAWVVAKLEGCLAG